MGKGKMFKPKKAIFLTLIIISIVFGCSGPKSDQPVLRAEVPLHLEEHIDDARIEGSEVQEDLLAPLEWRFDEPQPDWKPISPLEASVKPVQLTYTDGVLRIALSEANRVRGTGPIRGARQLFWGGIYTDLPEWHQDHWDSILVSVRTKNAPDLLQLGFNLRERLGPTPQERYPILFFSDGCGVIGDGSEHTYRLEVDRSRKWDEAMKQLCVMFVARELANMEILSIKAIPTEALYSYATVGLSTEVCSDAYRRTLFTHTPGKIDYLVEVPQAGRLDVGLGVVREDIPVTFRIKAIPKGREEKLLLEEVFSDWEHWAQRSVDLSNLAGQTVTLSLETEAERAGTVSLWAAPTLSGERATKKPNIILYVIDGASADYMSVYGYNRRTTPNLERLAAEGAIFEHAYSNATWTKVSNPSFMTSLYHSVLGGYTSESGQIPEQAITMAQLMHTAGYQTGVFTTNSYCGTMSAFDRGVDWLREKGEPVNFISSRELHKDFWEWRKAYPGEPYWVHVQTTDLHRPRKPEAPFAGLYLNPGLRMRYYEWEREVAKAAGRSYPTSPRRLPPDAFKKAGINHLEYFEATRCLNDEAMAHNDYQIGKLIERLKGSGEWENTLLIIAADHGSHFGLGLYDPIPPTWGPLFRSFKTRIPMIFVWPEHIVPGLRISQQVSMIDMLPTVVDLAGLSAPEGIQGQSLAPLLLGKEGWQPRPVIFDEVYVDQETGCLIGRIEIIEGRWGASLYIDPRPDDKKRPHYRLGPPTPFPVLIYDIWEDPNCLVPLNEERADLVEKYAEFLKAKWKEHQELAKRFSRPADVPLTPEQLRTLRSLGYIR